MAGEIVAMDPLENVYITMEGHENHHFDQVNQLCLYSHLQQRTLQLTKCMLKDLAPTPSARQCFEDASASDQDMFSYFLETTGKVNIETRYTPPSLIRFIPPHSFRPSMAICPSPKLKLGGCTNLPCGASTNQHGPGDWVPLHIYPKTWRCQPEVGICKLPKPSKSCENH